PRRRGGARPGTAAQHLIHHAARRRQRLAAAGMVDAPEDVARARVLLQLVQRVQREGVRQVDELRTGQLVSMGHVFSSPSNSASLAMASFTRIFTVPSGVAVFTAISLWLNPSK